MFAKFKKNLKKFLTKRVKDLFSLINVVSPLDRMPAPGVVILAMSGAASTNSPELSTSQVGNFVSGFANVVSGNPDDWYRADITDFRNHREDEEIQQKITEYKEKRCNDVKTFDVKSHFAEAENKEELMEKFDAAINKCYVCPLTLNIPVDAVYIVEDVIPDGKGEVKISQVYDYSSLAIWVENSLNKQEFAESPMTRNEITSDSIQPVPKLLMEQLNQDLKRAALKILPKEEGQEEDKTKGNNDNEETICISEGTVGPNGFNL